MQKYKNSISVFNGNNKRYTLEIPEVLIIGKFNDIAKKHFERNTGLKLKEVSGGYKTTPKTFKQIYKIFVTYNFQTTFYNNGSMKNTLKLSPPENNL